MYDKLKNKPGIIFYEIYIEEEICDENPFTLIDPDLDAQPSTMKQRVKMYQYSRDSLNLTIPSLIDSMDNYFVGKPYEGKPDGIYLIGVNKKFTYTYYYYHTWDWQQVFTQAETAVDNALKSLVNDTEAPKVEVTAPQQADALIPGGTYTIKWTATDNYSVGSRAIFLSTDDGSSWKLLDSTDGNTGGVYSWNVPADNSSKCKVKVCAYDRFFNEGKDESGSFSIGPTNSTHNPAETGRRIQFRKTQNRFMVLLPFSGNNSVVISDVLGKPLVSFTTSGDKLWYTLPESLSSGMHVISIKTPEKTIVQRFWFTR